MSGRVLILGATSAIARATARELAARGYSLCLAGRSMAELERDVADLRIRHQVDAWAEPFDAADTAAHEAFLDRVLERSGELAGVVLAFGELGDQQQAEHDAAMRETIIAANYTGAVSILSLCANHFETLGRGFIIGLSSVAGDRGRQSNYIYGSAKGGLTVFLAGLRNRLHPHNVRVITVKPGFVDTAMTYGLEGMFLVASPAAVGKRIVRTLDQHTNVLYVPWFWRYIMLIIRSIPELLFKRLKL